MIEIKDTTIVCIDCQDAVRGERALKTSLKGCSFEKVLFFSDSGIADCCGEWIQIPKITSKEAYSEFMIKQLHTYIQTKFVLVIQWDGYILNPMAWSDEFFKYDYIGARWHFHPDKRIGNGGFSLRSKALMQFAAEIFEITHPEDDVIGRFYHDDVVKAGFKFAPEHVALKFSVENEPYTGQFGWHGGSDAPV